MNRFMLVTIGVLSIIAGIFAILNPLSASITVELMVGWTFLLLGFFQVFVVFKVKEWKPRLWAITFGVIAVFLGVNLIAHPFEGLLTLTVILGVIFLVSGIFKIIIGFSIEGKEFKFLMFASGVISTILASIILINFPLSSESILGILLAVELIGFGISSIVLGSSLKKFN